MTSSQKEKEESLQKGIDKLLRAIIDDWYQNVSSFYVTQEAPTDPSGAAVPEELKRFHDERGHRIKFNKGELDFTYGLKSAWEDDSLVIEVSVNNKVENFDYGNFQQRLLAHYTKHREAKIPDSEKLGAFTYKDIFHLEPSLQEAFSIEKRDEKADIMRLAFRVRRSHLEAILADLKRGKQLIEEYCVSPFRSVYATVYRSTSR